MKIKTIINHLEKLCPGNLAIAKDPIGLQIGNLENNMQNILIALDCSKKVIQKAVKNQCNLILTHHPLFWPDKEKGIKESFYQKTKAKILNKQKITVYSLHTNYDEKYLKHQLLKKVASKSIVLSNLSGFICAKLLQKQSLLSFIIKMKQIWKLPKIPGLINNLNNQIETIAVVPGAGGFAIEQCIKKKIDLIITGEIKWSDWIICRDYQQNIITIGHHTEQLFIDHVTQLCQKTPDWEATTKIIYHWEKAVEFH